MNVKKPVLLLVLCVLLLAPSVFANPVVYHAFAFAPAASLGSTSYQCDPNTVCVRVDITFSSDTKFVQPFSENDAGGMASGFIDFTGQGSVTLDDITTGDSVSANFLAGQIYVSVDQTNNGIGFGSATGPTYPLGVYSGYPSQPYSTYDLKSNFSDVAFAWFCPPGVCQLGTAGPALQTDQGDLSITPTGVTYGFFFANVTASTPEPASLMLLGCGWLSLGLARRKK